MSIFILVQVKLKLKKEDYWCYNTILMPCKIVSILKNIFGASYGCLDGLDKHVNNPRIIGCFMWAAFDILVMQNCTNTLLLVLKSHLRDTYMKYLFAARGNVLKLIGQYLIPLCQMHFRYCQKKIMKP